MAFSFAIRAFPGLTGQVAVEGSFTQVKWPDGTTRAGAPSAVLLTSDPFHAMKQLAAMSGMDPGLPTAKEVAFPPLPDILRGHYYCISPRLRDLILSFEPDTHEFYPVRVDVPGADSEHRYFLHVKQSIDAMSEKHSRWVKELGRFWKPPPGRDKRLVFDTSRIGSAHLWHNRGTRYDRHFASEALGRALIDAGITGLQLAHHEEAGTDGDFRLGELPADYVYGIHGKPGQKPRIIVEVRIKEEALDGDVASIRFEDDPDGTAMKLPDAVAHGRRIIPQNVPTRLRYWQTGGKPPPDIHGSKNLGLTVSDRLKALIESFEPDTHQFLPVDFVTKHGDLLEQRWVFVVGALLSVKTGHPVPFPESVVREVHNEEYLETLVRREMVAGRHVWRDQSLKSVVISNDLAKAIEQRGWVNLEFHPARLTPVPAVSALARAA